MRHFGSAVPSLKQKIAMKIRYLHFIFGIAVLLAHPQARAQVVIDGTSYDNFGHVSNFDGYTTVTSAPGSIYRAGLAAVFDHFESEADALRVDNPYNAHGSGGSTDNFNGPGGIAGNQGIIGSVAPDFSTLVLKNGAASSFNITNTAGANVFTAADFQNGITTTDRANTAAGALRFQNGATYTGGTSDGQHVNGYVGKAGNAVFVFPVGSGTDVRTLSISAPSSASAVLTTAFETSSVEDGAAMEVPLQSVFPGGSWDWITGSAADDDGLTITVSIPDVTDFANTSDLRLVGWDGAKWIDLSGVATASGNTENSTLQGSIPAGTDVSQIGIGSTEPPLPVTLVSFTAKAENQVAVLSWSTTMETNSDRFDIEHSGNAKIWQLIGSVQSHGESNALKSYSFVHKTPAGGNNYYRLRMVDRDNTFAFSGIEVVRFGAEDMILHPNPTTGKVAVMTDHPSQIRSLQVVSLAGITLVNEKTDDGNATIDLRRLPAGLYLIKVFTADGKNSTHRIVKK